MTTISGFLWRVAVSDMVFRSNPKTPKTCAESAAYNIAVMLPGVEVKGSVCGSWHQFRWHGRIIDQPQASDVD